MTTPTNSHKTWTDEGGHVTANVAIAQQTIHHSGLMCSRLDLPVIPAG